MRYIRRLRNTLDSFGGGVIVDKLHNPPSVSDNDKETLTQAKSIIRRQFNALQEEWEKIEATPRLEKEMSAMKARQRDLQHDAEQLGEAYAVIDSLTDFGRSGGRDSLHWKPSNMHF